MYTVRLEFCALSESLTDWLATTNQELDCSSSSSSNVVVVLVGGRVSCIVSVTD